MFVDCATNRSYLVKSKIIVSRFFKPISGLIALAALFCVASCAWAQVTPGAKTSQSTPDLVKPRAAETEVIRLHPGQLPDVTLTSNVLFRILAAEIAAQRGSYLAAGTTLLDLARETGDPRVARRALEFYLAGGNLTGALDASRTWLRISPTDEEAVSTELALGAAAGQTGGLAQALRKRLDQATDKKAAINQAVATLARMPNRKEAFNILSEAISQSSVKHLAAARLALADMAQAAGDSKQAVTEARIALGVDPKSEEAAMRVLEYGIRNDPQGAIAEAREFAKRYPLARRLRLMLAGQLSEQGDFDGAMAEVASMARRTPEDFDLMFIQAQLAVRAKRLDEAKKFLDQYISVQKQRERSAPEGATDAGAALSDGYQLRSRILEEQGRLDDAFADLALVTDPSSAYFAARMRQAVIRGKQGRIDEALAIIDSTQAEDDEAANLAVLTANQVLRGANRLDEAIKRLDEADKLRTNSVEIKYDLAMLYEQKNNLVAAEKYLRQVIALDPGHAHSYNALGYALADRNIRLEEAQTLIARALEIMPDDPFILDSMGWVKFRLGDYPAAADYLTRAYVKRGEADIAAHLGEVYWAQGNKDKALAIWREGLAKDSQNPTLVDTLKRFGVKP